MYEHAVTRRSNVTASLPSPSLPKTDVFILLSRIFRIRLPFRRGREVVNLCLLPAGSR